MPETLGALTKGVARLCEHGEMEASGSGSTKSLSDIYEVWLGRGVRATSSNVSGLPAVNSVHPSFATLYVSGYRFSEVGAGNGVWHITVTYEPSVTASIGGGEVDTKITGRTWGVTESQCDILFDAGTGTPLLNAAGDPFDSVPQRTIFAPKVSFTRNESRSPGALNEFNGSINKEAVTALGIVFPARSARITISVRDTMAESGLRYECIYEISRRYNYILDGVTVKDIGWDDALIECGYNYITGDGQRYKFTVKTKTTTGEIEEKEVSSPQLLTELGDDGRGKPAVIKIIATHRELDWSGLSLP